MIREISITGRSLSILRPAVWKILGIPAGAPAGERTENLFREALELFGVLAQPRGLLADITGDAFGTVYRGEGRNEPDSPLPAIVPRADRLALFAVTAGRPVAQEIQALFEKRQFPLAAMLDAVASEGADQAAAAAETYLAGELDGQVAASRCRVLRYSPGYCGWHVSGQKKLFAFLQPERIGITLRESCLMEPLKSVSGVLVAGPPEIHTFQPSYPFCARCRDRECQLRASENREKIVRTLSRVADIEPEEYDKI